MIFGRPGGGKSTFAYQLHKIIGIPLYHLDKYFYVGNWQQCDYQKFLSIQQSIVNQETWIIDGNSTKSLEMRWAQADLVLYFNRSRSLCYYRVIKRLFDKNKFIDDRAQDCPEIITIDLLKYMWTFEDRVRSLIESCQQKYLVTPFLEIKSNTDLNTIMTQITQSHQDSKQLVFN